MARLVYFAEEKSADCMPHRDWTSHLGAPSVSDLRTLTKMVGRPVELRQSTYRDGLSAGSRTLS